MFRSLTLLFGLSLPVVLDNNLLFWLWLSQLPGADLTYLLKILLFERQSVPMYYILRNTDIAELFCMPIGPNFSLNIKFPIIYLNRRNTFNSLALRKWQLLWEVAFVAYNTAFLYDQSDKTSSAIVFWRNLSDLVFEEKRTFSFFNRIIFFTKVVIGNKFDNSTR